MENTIIRIQSNETIYEITTEAIIAHMVKKYVHENECKYISDNINGIIINLMKIFVPIIMRSVASCKEGFLFGVDKSSGINYDYRLDWVHDRLKELSKIFTIATGGWSDSA